MHEMLIQHILAEDIFTNIFHESQFHRENNIARELSAMIDTFFTGTTRRNTLKSIEYYYAVIRRSSENIANHHEKQKFLKALYENFYRAYNPKAADRLGIVYTPNEIVRFMIESADHLVHKHFGKLLSDEGVEILDPCTGTGTYVTEFDLFAMSVQNTARIQNQNDRKISVIIGNPSYNAWQENFNQNNANRVYGQIDKQIKATDIKRGTAQNQIAVYDMYTRFYRWASDRIGGQGLVAFITNRSFIDGKIFDGFRKTVSQEFDHVYIVDLGGDIRSGDTTGNVFDIKTGVAIMFLVKTMQE